MQIGKYTPFYSEWGMHLYRCGDSILVQDLKKLYFAEIEKAKKVTLYVDQEISLYLEYEGDHEDEGEEVLVDWIDYLVLIEMPWDHPYRESLCKFKHRLVKGNRLRFISKHRITDLLTLEDGVEVLATHFKTTSDVVAWQLCK